MADTPTIGGVLARKVRQYREAQGLRQEDLAERATALGWPINRVTLAKIESGGTRADNASIAEVLVLAAALDVPPPLLILPLGEGEEVSVTPNLVAHPHIALDWLAGEEPLAALPDNYSRNVEAWSQNSQPIKMFRGLRARQDAVHRADVAVRTTPQRTKADVERQFDVALSALDSWLEAMESQGLVVPEMPAEWRKRMDVLRDMGAE